MSIFKLVWNLKRANPLNKKCCKQKIVNFKRKLHGTKNIYFSFGDCLPLKVPKTNL